MLSLVETPALGQQCVNLINEDDAWFVFLGLSKEFPNSLSTHSHEHLIKVGTSTVDEASTCLPGYSPG